MKSFAFVILAHLSLLCVIGPAVSVSGQEDVLNLLVWEGYTPEDHIEKFEDQIYKKYGKRVRLSVTYAGSSDDFFDSVRGKEVDLITVSHHSITDRQFGYIEKGLLLHPDLINIPNHNNMITKIKNASYSRHNNKIYSIPLASGPYGLAYNSDAFQQAPQSWKLFWDPIYKNKYAIGAQEYLYNINITALVMGYPLVDISAFDKLNNTKFKEKLRQLAVNAGSYWIGVDKPEDLTGMSFGTSWGDSLTALGRMGDQRQLFFSCNDN